MPAPATAGNYYTQQALEAARKVREARDAAAKAETTSVKGDIAGARETTASLANALATTQPRTAPQGSSPSQVYYERPDATTAGNTVIAPAREASAAPIAPVSRAAAPTPIATRDAQASTLAPVERAAAQTAQAASISPIERAAAAQIAAEERIRAATISPIAQAAAERAQAATLGPIERAELAKATAAQIDAQNQSQLRADQVALSRNLQDVVAGTAGPSVAQLQLQQTTQQNIADAMAMAGAARGAYAASALRNAARQAATANQRAAGQAALVRATETDQARARLAGILGQAREQDIGLAGQQASLNQQAGLANAAAANTNYQFNASSANAAALEQARLQQQATLQNAQLGTNVNLANSSAQNTRSLEQARLEQTAALANQQAANTRTLTQAQIDQQTALANAAASNTRGLEQARLTQQADIFNAGAQNDIAQSNAAAANAAASQQAQLSQQASQFNSGQTNDTARLLAQLQAQNEQFNAGQTNDLSQLAAQLQTQTSQFNAGQVNDVAGRQAALDAQLQQFNATAQNQAELAGTAAANQAGLTSAQLQQQMTIENMNSILQQTSLDDAQKRALIDAMLQSQGQVLQSGTSLATAKMAADAQKNAASKQMAGDIVGGIAEVGVKALAMSDERAKKNIEPLSGSGDIADLLSKIRPSKFDYKDTSMPGTAEGKRYGVMAQDLEKSAMGRSLVTKIGDKKAIDVGQAVGALLAAMSDMHARVKKVERRAR